MDNTVNIGLLDHSFQHLFEEAPFAAALYAGPEFILEMANETSLNLWRKDSSILGMPLLRAMPEKENQPLFQILQKVYESGTIYEGRERATIQDVNGNPKKVYINYVYKPIRDDDKNVRGILAIGYVVTKQVAEKKDLKSWKNVPAWRLSRRAWEPSTSTIRRELSSRPKDSQTFLDLKHPFR